MRERRGKKMGGWEQVRERRMERDGDGKDLGEREVTVNLRKG